MYQAPAAVQARIPRDNPDWNDILSMWVEAIQAGQQDVAGWFDRNPHLIERAVIKIPLSPDMQGFVLRNLYRIEPPERKPVLVCAMPKGGSTSFCELLAATIDRPSAEGHTKNTGQHLGLELDYLRRPIADGAVIHSHLPATPNVLALCKALGITPLVVLRNVFDAMESRHRYEATTEVTRVYGMPNDMESAFVRFAYDYLCFASQWLKSCEIIGWPVFYFEDNIRDWRETMVRACKTARVEPINLDRAISDYETLKRIVPEQYRISGQAKQKIPDQLVTFVLNLAARFPGPDMSRLLER